MKILALLLIALTSCQFVQKKNKDPLPVVKCLLESDKLANDVVLVVEAVKKFVEDKDLNSLLSVLLVAVPDAYNEVMVCVKKNVNLEKFPKIKIPKIKIPKIKKPKFKIKLPKIKLPKKFKIGKIIKGMKFKDLTKKLQKRFKKMIKRVPKKLLNGILNSLKDYGIDQAKKLCNDQIDGGEAICDNLEMLKDEIKINIK